MALWIGALLLLVCVLAVPSTLHASRVTARLVRVGATEAGVLPGAQDRSGTPATGVGTIGQPSPVVGQGASVFFPREMRLGIWHQAKFTSNPVGIGDDGIAGRLELGPNHPNPFRENTRLSLALPARDQVLLQVFEVSGREVGTLVDEELDGGLYEIHLQAGSLSPGLYFVRLRTSQGTASRKILLLD